MTTSPTNRFLTKALRITCCAAVLTACSAWATVVNWQLSPIGENATLATKDLSQPGYTSTARGVDAAAGTDASGQLLLKRAPQNAAASLADALNQNPQTRATEESQPVLTHDSDQISTGSTQPADSFLIVDSQPQPVLQSGGALAHAFDEEFVSVPTVQFSSMTAGPKDSSGTSMAAVSTDPAPVPEMSALFPIIGLIAAVSCTRILRRRRAAQMSAPRSLA